MSYSLENARFQWESAAERIRGRAGDSGGHTGAIAGGRGADRVIEAVREGLRRRLGSGFSAEQLADLYGQGTDWCQELAMEVSDAPFAPQDAIDAAFWEHLRLARDFSGGVAGAG